MISLAGKLPRLPKPLITSLRMGSSHLVCAERIISDQLSKSKLLILFTAVDVVHYSLMGFTIIMQNIADMIIVDFRMEAENCSQSCTY